MRLTFQATMRDAYDGIETAAERMIKFQRQVSTGIRVAQPSDDPSATATAISEKAAHASYEQYVQAGDSAESRLAVADTLLSDIISKLAAARSAILSVQGSETTDAQRENGAQELASLRDAVLEDLTTSFRGTYMFGGAAGTVRPYSKDGAGVVQAYAGSTREVTVDVDRNRPVTVVFNGDAIVDGGDATDLFQAFEDAIAAARTGDAEAANTASHALQRAFDRASQVQSSVGTSLRAIEDHTARLQEAGRGSTSRVAALEEANMAAAISGLRQSETAYNAALGAAASTTRRSLFDYLFG
jgi:flagellar hook-associated protein 3 FlgL